MNLKKAQEEIVGFALIVLLVVIIGMVFLSISLRKQPAAEQNDKEVSNFLDAMLQYTSDCESSFATYLNTKDLIKACYNNEICLSGRSACQHLREASTNLLNAGQDDLAAEQLPVKAYQLNISYAAEQVGFQLRKQSADILNLKRGNCTGASIATREFLPLDTGSIDISLKFCY